MDLVERFWAKVDKSPGCWLWNGATNLRGNGQVRIGGKLFLAHHLAWEWAHGPLPKFARLCWECRTPNCVRPEPGHLFVGDYRMKLTARDVMKIRASSQSQRSIAADYGVSQQLIAKVRSGRAWKHVS